MAESIFIADGECFLPSEQARGPWDPQALHGGAPAALIVSAFERMLADSAPDGAELRIGRLSFEFLRPIPLAPLTLSTQVVRPGRRVRELAAELLADEQTIVRASALSVAAVPEQTAAAAPGAQLANHVAAMEPASSGKPIRFALDGGKEASFAGTAMEMRWLSDPKVLGPGRVWMRLRHPLLPGETTSPLARLAATADFGNGISATLPFDRFVFINADLTVHLQRAPSGEWIGLDACTVLHDGGVATAESVLHDQHGPLGRAFQTLVVQQR
ncbi:MAG TPA: thioesterase family protein [Solirubrobacteraceae bacterium]|jgi:acyl-coenzyme A thioesterase PaaI-like protein|nr:thioesterase family protein [Solirubrobacteraceae bacterium]